MLAALCSTNRAFFAKYHGARVWWSPIFSSCESLAMTQTVIFGILHIDTDEVIRC
jgi:hypothetical protein